MYIGSSTPGTSSITGTPILIHNSPKLDQSPLLPETHHPTTLVSPLVVHSVSIGAASVLPVSEATSESLQMMSTEDTGEFSLSSMLNCMHYGIPFCLYTGNESDNGVACKRKLFSGAVMPGLLRNLFHNVILSTDIHSHFNF